MHRSYSCIVISPGCSLSVWSAEEEKGACARAGGVASRARFYTTSHRMVASAAASECHEGLRDTRAAELGGGDGTTPREVGGARGALEGKLANRRKAMVGV